MVFQDRDPASVSVGLEAFADDRRAGGRVGRQELGDPLGERVELRARRGTNVARRLTPGEQPVDRVRPMPRRRAIAAFASPSRWKSRWTSAQSST